MNESLKRRFDTLEAVRQRIESRIDTIDPAMLNRQPEPGRWSVAQVIGHLVKAETLSVSYIVKKASDPSQLRPATISHSLKALLVIAAMYAPVRISAPEIVAEVPANEDAVELCERWKRMRGEMRSLLEGFPDALLGTCVFKHPVGGPMRLDSAIDFMIAHSKRHAKQIERVLRSVRGE